MTRQEFFAAMEKQRYIQDGSKWGPAFDDKNTANDWASYFNNYLAQTSAVHVTRQEYELGMIKIASIALAAVETLERNGGKLPPRHYD